MKDANTKPASTSLIIATAEETIPAQLRKLQSNCTLVFPLDTFRESYVRQACSRLKWEEQLKFRATRNREARTLSVTKSA